MPCGGDFVSNLKPTKGGFFSGSDLIIDDKYCDLLIVFRCFVGLAGGGRAEWII